MSRTKHKITQQVRNQTLMDVESRSAQASAERIRSLGLATNHKHAPSNKNKTTQNERKARKLHTKLKLWGWASGAVMKTLPGVASECPDSRYGHVPDHSFLLMHLLAGISESPRVWVPATHMEDTDAAPGP